MRRAQLAEGSAAIRNDQTRPGPGGGFVEHDGDGAVLQRFFGETVAVEIITAQGEEEVAGLELAGVGADAAKGGCWIPVMRFAAAGVADKLQCPFHQRASSMAAKTARAVSRSSNGKMVSLIS